MPPDPAYRAKNQANVVQNPRRRATPEELAARAAARAVRIAQLKTRMLAEVERRGGGCERPGCDVTYGQRRCSWHHRESRDDAWFRERTTRPDQRMISALVSNAKTTDDELARELAKCILLCRHHHADADSERRGRKERKKRALPRGIDPDDAERLVRAANIRYLNGLRGRLVVELMLRCGLRVSEVCNLKTRQLRQSDWRIEIRGSKTGDRFVYLPSTMEPTMLVWLRRRLDELPASPYLFPTASGGKITRGYVAGMIDRLAWRAGIAETHPHALRHTYATEFIRNGGDPATLQEILGHRTATMSLRYAKANPERVRRAMRGSG